MSLFGELREVDDVEAAFADLVVAEAPSSIARAAGSKQPRASLS